MERRFRFLLFFLVVVSVATGVAFAADPPITLELDGKVVETEVPPIIVSGRTMAPAKFLFEAMGGQVDWDNDARKVTVVLNGTTVVLTIDSNRAQVNGTDVTMDVAPMIVNRRTLVPTSFVAEQLGCKVEWLNDTRMVRITSPTSAGSTNITSIDTEGLNNDTYRIIVQGDKEIENYKGLMYDAPDRYVLDISGALLQVSVDGIEGKLVTDNGVFTSVRYSQFDATTVRVMADLTGDVTAELNLSADKKSIYIDLKARDGSGQDNSQNNNGNNGNNGANGGSTGTPADITGLGIPQLDPSLSDKLVFIDPGHGGTDSGALGKDSNGKIIQMEKDLNLTIAMRLNELLQGAGVKTYILRSDDSSIALYDRPALANQLNASLYVSIHNNSNESATPNGTETLYYNKGTEAGYGYTSKNIAESVQSELVKGIGLKDRGAKSSPFLAVLNRSQMPAIIIEGGFISNAAELKYMMTDSFKEAYAVGAARGIVKALNASVGK